VRKENIVHHSVSYVCLYNAEYATLILYQCGILPGQSRTVRILDTQKKECCSVRYYRFGVIGEMLMLLGLYAIIVYILPVCSLYGFILVLLLSLLVIFFQKIIIWQLSTFIHCIAGRRRRSSWMV